jgi:hypothetical protein
MSVRNRLFALCMGMAPFVWAQGYIVVFFSHGNGIKGTELAVARSADGGKSYPFVNYFSFSGGSNHFNDKPMITTDTNLTSPFQDNIYVAWDAASGGSTSGGLRFARSADHGATFMTTRIDNPSGPGRVIAADPFVGPNGEVYAAWDDIATCREISKGTLLAAKSRLVSPQLNGWS